MKRLVLVRHGKSSWDNDLPDHRRPLKNRAYKDAEVVLNSFQNFYEPGGLFWSSHAVRAHETAKIFKERLKVPDDHFEVKEELYTFNQNDLLSVIQSCGDETDKLIVFGHNPAMTILVNSLGDKRIDNLPTTGLCVIDFEVDSWEDIRKGKTILTLMPKNLR
ncbi:SixA phosphatase family protein [Christiangramia sabulilitoris]|uniref:Histidine phosphatase family protein n=1 Tax=Christiangramia sabulilitoris TaxID=2583991 RepID=A0A550I5P4_9FLAO|nr:histidine phosphatase family protein [Christiangramia sabulilitoris]TRO66304.1 histidine phosphatase family protein [Christiangramia sabulilitoris]